MCVCVCKQYVFMSAATLRRLRLTRVVISEAPYLLRRPTSHCSTGERRGSWDLTLTFMELQLKAICSHLVDLARFRKNTLAGQVSACIRMSPRVHILTLCIHQNVSMCRKVFPHFFSLQIEPSNSCIGSVWTNLKHLIQASDPRIAPRRRERNGGTCGGGTFMS